MSYKLQNLYIECLKYIFSCGTILLNNFGKEWRFGQNIQFHRIIQHRNKNNGAALENRPTFIIKRNYRIFKLNKEWKQQTVGTYLSHLQKAGIIKTDKRFSKLYLYFPSCTKEEYLEKCACNFVEQVFDNSLSSFIAAFAKEGKISQRDAEELKKLI